VRAHASSGPKFDKRQNGGSNAGGAEEEEGGMTSDTPLRSCCKLLARPPPQVCRVVKQKPKPVSRVTSLHPYAPPQPTTVVLVAFGFKLGVPDFIDFIFDVRSVPNPWKMNDFKVEGEALFGRGFVWRQVRLCDFLAGARRYAHAAAGGSHAGALAAP
jgi:hypothetical protein